MPYEKNKKLVKEWHELFGSEELNSKYDKYLHENFTADYFGQIVSKVQYIAQDQRAATVFKNNKMTILDQIAGPDKVVSVILWSAIFAEDIQGIPATGKPINIQGICIDYFQDGKVIKHFLLFDTAKLLKRKALHDQVSARLARDLHDNIGSTLGSISYYSEMARQMPEGNLPQLKMLLQKIEETSHELVREMSDIVWALNPANDSFEKLTMRMKNYASDLLATRNIKFDFKLLDVNESLRLTVEQRKNIFLIFKEAVYNALKYAGCTHLDASIHQTKDHLVVELNDNGKGFNPQQLTSYNGNGISNMKQRAKEIGTEFFLFSQIGKGTQIRFEVPLKEDQLSA